MQQKAGQHEQRQGEQQGVQKHQKIKHRAGDNRMLGNAFTDTGKAAKHKNEKIAHEKALAPAVDPGNDGGEPQPDHA